MLKRRSVFLAAIILLTATRGAAQQTDSLQTAYLEWRRLILPSVLLSYGISSICNPKLTKLNTDVKGKICGYNPFHRTHIDDYIQYASGIAVLGLNAAGIKGKSSIKDLSLTCLLSNAILTTVVCASKNLVHQERPDKSAYNSFPSGHTAAAFAGAELLYQEYRDRSVWYGVAGYTCATAAGYFRMYNNRHSLADVMAGAAVGIVSTKLAYFTYGKLKAGIFKKKQVNTDVIAGM